MPLTVGKDIVLETFHSVVSSCRELDLAQLLSESSRLLQATIQRLDWRVFLAHGLQILQTSAPATEILSLLREWELFIGTEKESRDFWWIVPHFLNSWLRTVPNPANRVLMDRLFGSMCSLALCCTRGGSSRYQPHDDSEEAYFANDSDNSLDPETANLVRKSLKSRIAQYETAMAQAEQKPQGSNAPTPYKRSKSTSYVVGQFEQKAAEQVVPSPRRLVRDEYNRQQGHVKSQNTQKAIHQNVNLPRCPVCVKSVYPTDASIDSFGRKLHAACFSCRLCQSKLTHHPLEVQFEVPIPLGDAQRDKDGTRGVQNILYCVCAKCQQESMLQGKPKIIATVAGEKVKVGQAELGDVDGVKDAIGDELEEILLEKAIPRCQVCGADFLSYTGNICMVGHAKYHEECWQTGRPMGGLQNDPTKERALTPVQAAKYLPDRWILRLVARIPTPPNGSSSSVKNPNEQTTPTTKSRQIILATLFFVWTKRVTDLQALPQNQRNGALPTQVSFDLDNQAMGNPNYVDAARRKVQARLPTSMAGEGPVLDMELLGNPMSLTLKGQSLPVDPIITGSSSHQTTVLESSLSGSKFQVDHTLQLCLNMSKEENFVIDLASARLTMSLSKQ